MWAGAATDHFIDLGWSADGRCYAVAASAGRVTVFDATTGTGDRPLNGHHKGTLVHAWSPVAPILATDGNDRRVRLWDPTSAETACLEAATNWVERLAWHPNVDTFSAAAGMPIRPSS